MPTPGKVSSLAEDTFPVTITGCPCALRFDWNNSRMINGQNNRQKGPLALKKGFILNALMI